ncbi:TPA: hypothetical protein DCX15_06170 [bacterium]|nr:hypothetical protein [bacterium]
MDLGFLKLIATLGKKYSRNKVAAPLIMTPRYIERSLDVFPIEFLNLKLIHTAVFPILLAIMTLYALIRNHFLLISPRGGRKSRRS